MGHNQQRHIPLPRVTVWSLGFRVRVWGLGLFHGSEDFFRSLEGVEKGSSGGRGTPTLEIRRLARCRA